MNMSTKRFAMRRAIVLAAITLVAFAAIASSAIANPTVSVNSSKSLLVTGGSEDSNVDVSYLGGYYIVERTGGDLVNGGTPCLTLASNKVSCFFGANAPNTITIDLGDGLDAAEIDSTVPDTTTAVVKNVWSAVSGSAPLDATINDVTTGAVGIGGPKSDTIKIDMPSACSVSADGGAGDDHISIKAQTLDPENCGDVQWPVTGGDGDDMINAEESTIAFEYQSSEGHDIFMGGSGADHITVGEGPDWAFGGGGNDRFYDNGGPDPAKLWGGPGHDVFTDWDGDDLDMTFFDGGSGSDTVAYHNIVDTYDVSVSLNSVANDGVSGEMDNMHPSVERVGTDGTYNTTGQFRGNDTITGNDGVNWLWGRNGNDTIDALGGQDEVRGGNGDDIITGGTGTDTLYGEVGNDEIFAEDGEADVIFCGPSTADVAHADSIDTVNADCETVL